MTIAELGKKYKLDGKVDVWKCHDNWILTFDAITKIALIENIKLSRLEPIYQSDTSCRFLVTMVKEDKDGNVIDSVTSVGEADNRNSKNNYYGSMSEKRGISRGVLKIINTYQYGIYSEVEADDFKRGDSQ